MSLLAEEADLGSLALLFTEEVYVSSTSFVTDAEQIVNPNINEPVSAVASKSAPETPLKPSFSPLAPAVRPTVTEPSKPTQIAAPKKTNKKLVILVGYPNAVPPAVQEALLKTTAALQIPASEVVIINALQTNGPTEAEFAYPFLVLMGGSGKAIEWLKDFTGTRNRYDCIRHKGIKVLFAEPMDVYLADKERARTFWNALKNMVMLT